MLVVLIHQGRSYQIKGHKLQAEIITINYKAIISQLILRAIITLRLMCLNLLASIQFLKIARRRRTKSLKIYKIWRTAHLNLKLKI